MTDIEILRIALSQFAQLDDEDFNLSLSCWKINTYKKGEFYNPYKSICRYLGFTMEGYFRAYMIDANGDEKNIFLYLPHQVVVTYKSFIHEIPCDYNTQALTDARAICITLADLQTLYNKSHGWERFGRLVAEKAFDIANDRAESFLFKSGDMKTLTEIFHENSSWHTPGRSPIAGDQKGRNAVFAHFGRYAGETGGTFKAILKSVAISEDGRIVGIHHNTAIRNGKKLEVDCCIVFEFKDGLMIDGREYFYDLHAWNEFWS